MDEVLEASAHPGLGVRGCEDQSMYASEDEGARAHRTRLQRHIESAVAESPVAALGSRLPQDEYLSVGSGVGELTGLVVVSTQQLVAANQRRSDRHFLLRCRGVRLLQGDRHPTGIIGDHTRHRRDVLF